MATGLKALAARRGQSVGELVRQALSANYRLDLMDLPPPQRQALEAYQGGYISLGKLAEAMGLHVLQTRQWLAEHGLAENSCCGDDDTDNA